MILLTPCCEYGADMQYGRRIPRPALWVLLALYIAALVILARYIF